MTKQNFRRLDLYNDTTFLFKLILTRNVLYMIEKQTIRDSQFHIFVVL